jgi:hypothetical protein
MMLSLERRLCIVVGHLVSFGQLFHLKNNLNIYVDMRLFSLTGMFTMYCDVLLNPNFSLENLRKIEQEDARSY